MTEQTIREAEALLSQQDPVLGALIKRQKLSPIVLHDDYFAALCKTIVGQQLSTAAAKTIFARLSDKTGLKPETIRSLEADEARTIGLSGQKTRYITDLAAHFVENPRVYNHLETQSDQQVIAELTQIKGIGTWSAQMFLIFTLGRMDVFAPDDIGLQRAVRQLYAWESVSTKRELEAFAHRWSPYRSVASLHLWHSLDNKKWG